jgi:hypothetical protein
VFDVPTGPASCHFCIPPVPENHLDGTATPAGTRVDATEFAYAESPSLIGVYVRFDLLPATAPLTVTLEGQRVGPGEDVQLVETAASCTMLPRSGLLCGG